MLRDLVTLLRRTVARYSEERAGVLAAALAYRALFTMAPVGVLTLTIVGWVVGADTARRETAATLSRALGPRLARELGSILASARPGGRAVAGVLAALIVVYGAGSLMLAVKQALDDLMDLRIRADAGWGRRAVIYGVPFSLALVPASALVSLIVADAVARFLLSSTLLTAALASADLLVAWAIVAILLRYLPSGRVGWTSIAIGSFVTAVGWVALSQLFGLYLRRAAFVSAYGAAGSLVALLVWIDLIAQIALAGATLTVEHARLAGRPIRPMSWARLSESSAAD